MLHFVNRLATVLLLAAAGVVCAEQSQNMDSISIDELHKRAQEGDLAAELRLADKLYSGEDGQQDLAQAAQLYKHLAEQGFLQAQITLGLMYIKGMGIEKNDEEAVKLFTLAAEQKSPLAQYLLGVAYEGGHGVNADKVKAYMWYEVSAALNYQSAIAAQKALAPKLSAKQIRKAEQMAADWWLQFHQ